jgi:hypothetical protein
MWCTTIAHNLCFELQFEFYNLLLHFEIYNLSLHLCKGLWILQFIFTWIQMMIQTNPKHNWGNPFETHKKFLKLPKLSFSFTRLRTCIKFPFFLSCQWNKFLPNFIFSFKLFNFFIYENKNNKIHAMWQCFINGQKTPFLFTFETL